MRPLELTVEGFRSYRGSTTFDWRDRRLVGIVGPIGSGKSSILDAVAFALYGKTPAFEAATRSLIHQQLDQGHVELRFSVEGQVWRAARGLRRKGQSGHQLERLASDSADAEVLETVAGEAGVTARVTSLLGMDFKTFCRSVLLAQNRFAELLHARPADRDQVLKGVFGLERLDRAHEVAKGRLAAARAELDAVAGEMGRIADARERLPGTKEAEAAARDRVLGLEAVAPEVERLSGVAAAGRDAVAAADERISEIESLTRELPAVADIDRLAEEAAASEDDGRRIAEAAREAEERRVLAEREMQEAEERAGGRDRLERAGTLITQRDHQLLAVEEHRTRVEAADGRVAEAKAGAEAGAAAETAAGAALAEADEALDAAGITVAAAETALEEARHGDMAAALRAGLTRGEPCPVCAQPVAVVPRGARGTKAETAGRALERARAAQDKRRKAADEARAGLAARQARTTALREALTAARRDAKAATDALAKAARGLERTDALLVDLLGPGDPVEELSSRRKTMVTARETLQDAEQAARTAAVARDDARAIADRIRDEAADVAARLSGVWGRLGESRAIGRTADQLRAAFADVGARLVSIHEESVAARDVAATSERDAAAALDALVHEAGVELGRSFSAAVTEAATEHGTARARVEEIERVLAGQRALTTRVKKAERRRDLAERLSEDLRPSAFLRFLLEEERAELSALGSEHFQDLTDGSYRFSDDGEFAVLDLNAAGTSRRADSLSGGETFLASLALALALAEMVARGGGRMDAFFLDEGFGSLDPDHLDRAMEGIERLVAESEHRLVVVVSHVSAMREAIEDLVVLDKDATTGDTIVRTGARSGA